MGKAFRRTFLVVLILIVAYFGSILYFFSKSHGMNFSSESNGDNTSILVLGVDSLDSTNGENSRSDTIMVLNYNKPKNQVSLLSIPRDTKTAIEGRKYQEKINHSYAYGGVELTLKTVNNLLGTDIRDYVVVDYNLVEKMIDVLGGVEVDVPQEMKYEDPTANPPLYIDLQPGLQVLNGNKSMQFLRFRGYPTADLGRISAQQAFMGALMKKVKSPLTLVKLPFIMKTYSENSNSNVALGTIANIMLNAMKTPMEQVQTVMLPGEPQTIKGVSYYIMYENQTRELINGILN